jgi:hypothetical protein
MYHGNQKFYPLPVNGSFWVVVCKICSTCGSLFLPKRRRIVAFPCFACSVRRNLWPVNLRFNTYEIACMSARFAPNLLSLFIKLDQVVQLSFCLTPRIVSMMSKKVLLPLLLTRDPPASSGNDSFERYFHPCCFWSKQMTRSCVTNTIVDWLPW